MASYSRLDTSPLAELQHYAASPNPEELSPHIRVAYNATTLTVRDAFPKSYYHLLVLPRPREGLTMRDLYSLGSLLQGDKERAKRVLEEMGEAAEQAKAIIEEDMPRRSGWKWDIWVGFHALPSMRHVHLHVMSADLNGPFMKKKKHYNSFHPKLGFFLHYKDVMEWFDATPSYYELMSEFRPSMYKEFLTEDLQCFRCRKDLPNMPKLIEHLKEEFHAKKVRWMTEARERERAIQETQEKKRKREEESAAAADKASTSTEPPAVPSEGTASPLRKRQATEDSEDSE